MAISFRSATGITATTDTTSPFANITFTLPALTQTDDLLIAVYGGKPFGTQPGDPVSGTAYTVASSIANGTTGTGGGTGSVFAEIWYKTHDGTEGNPASTMPATYSIAMTAMIALRKTVPGSWSVQSTTGIDATNIQTTYSATAADILRFSPGDFVVASYVHNDDSSSSSAFNISIPGCTLDSLTQRLTGTLTTGTGDDGRMYVVTARVVSGVATGAAVVTATTGNNDSDGASIILRVSEPVRQSWGYLND
jgi:hypothetical protein